MRDIPSHQSNLTVSKSGTVINKTREDYSEDHDEDTGDWPVSGPPEELSSHIEEFAAAVLQPTTAAVYFCFY